MVKIDSETAVDIFLAHGPYKAIARRYGISASNISKIKTGVIHCDATRLYTSHEGALVMNGVLVSAAFGVAP